MTSDLSPDDSTAASAGSVYQDATEAQDATTLWLRAISLIQRRRQFISTVAVSFVIVALQMTQGILLARLLGPQGRGEYATAVLYVQTLLFVGLFGGLEVVCRYAADKTIDRDRLRRAALWLGMTTGTVTMLITIGLSMFAIPADKQYLGPMAALCALSLIGQHVMLIMTAVDRGSDAFGAYNWRRIIAAAAFPLLLLITWTFIEINLLITCWLFVGASLMTMLACVAGVPKPFRGESHPPVPRLLRESRPYALSMFMTDMFDRLDLLLILWLAPLVEQGFYAAMLAVVFPVAVIPNTMGLFLFNAGSNRDRRLTTKGVHRMLGSIFLLQVASTIPFMLIIGMVVRFLYGEAFAGAVIFALWLTPVSAVKGVMQGLESYVKGRGKPLAAMRCRICACFVMLGVAWLLFDQHGPLAVAMAALAAQIFCLVWLCGIIYADVRNTEPADDFPEEG